MCVRLVRYHQIVVAILLPIMLSACVSGTQLHAQPEDPAAPRAAGQQRRQCWPSAAVTLRLVARAAAAWAWLDRRLVEGCRRLTADPLTFVAGGWFFSSCAWWLAMAEAETAQREQG